MVSLVRYHLPGPAGGERAADTQVEERRERAEAPTYLLCMELAPRGVCALTDVRGLQRQVLLINVPGSKEVASENVPWYYDLFFRIQICGASPFLIVGMELAASPDA